MKIAATRWEQFNVYASFPDHVCNATSFVRASNEYNYPGEATLLLYATRGRDGSTALAAGAVDVDVSGDI